MNMNHNSSRNAWRKLGIVALAMFAGCETQRGPEGPPAVAASTAVTPAPAGFDQLPSGTIDLERSRVYVFVDKKGAGHQHGVEGRLSGGTFMLGRTEQAGKLKFDMKSFLADTSAARRRVGLAEDIEADEQADITTTMRGASVLDATAHPTAEFVIASARPLPPQAGRTGTPYQIDGEFELHGVRQPLTFTAFAEQTTAGIRLQGEFVFKQTDFGIRPFKKFLGAVGVADQLKVYGELWIAP